MLCKKTGCEYNKNNECKCDYVSINSFGVCSTYVSVFTITDEDTHSYLDIKPFRMKEDE